MKNFLVSAALAVCPGMVSHSALTHGKAAARAKKPITVFGEMKDEDLPDPRDIQNSTVEYPATVCAIGVCVAVMS